jgi:hypothetical protein
MKELKYLSIQGNSITQIKQKTMENIMHGTNIQNIQHEWGLVVQSIMKSWKN